MKILKKGNIEKIHKVKRFSCDKCGCEFEVDETEYKLADYMLAMYDGIEATCQFPTCKSNVCLRR